MKNIGVLACFKNESAILVEWIEHYLNEETKLNKLL
jgi:hypothetical protein